MKKSKKKVTLNRVPKVTKLKQSPKDDRLTGFPVDHYSYSSFVQFATNPLMFKINRINGDVIETTSTATNVLGKACHKALEAYFGGGDVPTPADEGEAIKVGYEVGRQYLESYSDGLIEWNATISDRAKLNERYSFTYFAYIRELGFDPKKQENLLVEKMLKHAVSVDGRALPIPLKAAADRVYREGGKLKIQDHKFTTRHSSEEKIDGSKLLQAAFNYFAVYAETGEKPYSMTFSEMKVTENRGKNDPQAKHYTIVFEEMPLLFDLFFRMYDDITNALLGTQVYVPNLFAIFDNEVSLLAYIHRLDVDEKKAALLKKANVDNITDFLKKKISRTKALREYMDTVARKFVSATTLNYSTMTIEEKIKMKLAEHGIGIEFDSKVVGPTVTLYRYEPSIGVKMTRIEQYEKDIELVTSSAGVRILAPIPGTELIGFEVPNKERTFLATAPKARELRVGVGVDIQGNTQYIDIKTAPHVLIAGTTGSGKSVALTSILNAIGGSADLWLMDPKQVELQDMPASKYADTAEEIDTLLESLVGIMHERYGEMKALKQKQWTGRRIVAVVDEFGDLMLNKKGLGESIKRSIILLGQKARAAGIHLIIATQRPSVNIIDGLIKANFPTRIALKTASAKDSEVILGVKGSEKLCGKGDMLLQRSDTHEIVRVQGFSD